MAKRYQLPARGSTLTSVSWGTKPRCRQQPLQGPGSSGAARKVDLLPATLAHTLGIQRSSNLPGMSQLGKERPLRLGAGAGVPRRPRRADSAPLRAGDAISTLGGVFQLHRKQ